MNALSHRDRKRLLWAIDAALATAIAACVACVWLPLETGVVPDAGPVPPLASAPAAGALPLPPDAYAVIYQRNLRLPLFDAPASAPTLAVAPPMPVRLKGTILEPGFCYAVFERTNGESRMVGVGESVDGVEVVAIAAASITVRYNGQLAALAVDKEGPKR